MKSSYGIFLLLSVFVNPYRARATDFKTSCGALASQQGFKPAVCQQVHDKFFTKIDINKAMAEFSPKDVGAPALKIDPKIRLVAFNDAMGASALTYCYFLHKGLFDPSIGPAQLATASSGFSLTADTVGAYQEWVAGTDEGKKCKARVEQETGYAFPNLESELKGNVAFVGVVPLAALYGGFHDLKTVETEMKVTVNHGRVLAYVQSCPALQAWGQKQWLSLSDQDRKVISSKLSAYKWDDVAVAGREYTAFTFENDPTKIAGLTKDCSW